ncbi:hypothetical protein M422DRAFT_167041 [Sphaerobolus stellatus SS14]|uniref:FYVE-type domain-containing protein n=1 Tax=Sphaerobolus stellatus (strain SS14) TaxID=990650 RepID=A0A0C9VS08_SPHS4|nr:hypothetical protein M422DRAFT_167041 [Sphaerobolus stellatus SS14]
MISLDGDVLTHPQPSRCRRNEHLAVLIPRHLWKADKLATRCDKYACRIRFSIWERKHHCRKCGGIYCHACSSRTTTLLDTTKLPFLLPPKNTPISQYAAPNAPVVDARVCDDCWDQVHGNPAPRTSYSKPSSPQRILISEDTSSSVSTLSPSTPPEPRPLFVRTISASPRRRPFWQEMPIVHATKLEGDLDRYPLKDPSETCKAAGSGRWSPKPVAPRWDARLPDGRLRHEVEVDRLEEEHRRRLANPVIVDGEIRVRRPSKPQPQARRAGHYQLPTF